MFLAACLATLCLLVPAGAIWMGIEALDRSDHTVTAVLLDVSMPRMGGSETLRHIRERRRR